MPTLLLADFDMDQHTAQVIFPNLLNQFHPIVVVAAVHDVRDDPLGLMQGFVR